MSKVYNIGGKSFIRVPVQPVDNYTKNLIIIPNTDDSERYIEEKITSIIDEEGEIQGYIIVLHDLTKIFEFDQMRKKLISSASHELRTPITIIRQSIKSLNKYKDRIDEKTKERLLNMIAENAVLLSDIVEGLELISSIDQNKIKLHLMNFNLKDILTAEVTNLSSKWENKNIKVNLVINDKVNIIGDREALTKAFRCLIDNAIKYSRDNGEVSITVIDEYKGEFNPTDRSGILVQIVDKGIGISREYYDKIFESFFRIKDINTTSGAGIGLSIAKGIIKLHNGEIYIESELEKGSTFSVFLPKNFDNET
ncbi:MAG: sensor histidine kinase [Candidatus Hodarchaeales archaeon]